MKMSGCNGDTLRRDALKRAESAECGRVISCSRGQERWRTELELCRRESFDDSHRSAALGTAPQRVRYRSGRSFRFVFRWNGVKSGEALWQQGGIPVLASLALGADGEYYNVNADEMAAACAAACHANALIFLTDVPGVKDAEGAVIPWLSTKQAQDLADGSIISGGMLPKLEACRQALKHGVGRVRILPAAEAEALPQFYLTKLNCGTEVTCA